MNLLKLSWKNLGFKPLSTLLGIILFTFGTGLMIFLALLSKQLEDSFDKNLAGVDLVLGAKGSPLQLILCGMFHIDSPTGNMSIKKAKPFLNPNHPLIAKAYPLALGDSYRNYRIVGTTPDYLNLYQAKIKEGVIFQQNLEVVIGNQVATDLKLNIGSTFKSNHGLTDDGNEMLAHDATFKVVGILETTGAVIDQLILTPIPSIWEVHEHHGSEEQASPTPTPTPSAAGMAAYQPPASQMEGHDEHDEHEHHASEHTQEMPPAEPTLDNWMNQEDKEITSILIQYRNKTSIQTLNMPRNINESTDFQAANPAIEMNRLYAMLGVGENLLKTLATIVMVISGLSIFISLFNALKERKYELALLRVMGASRWKVFFLILLEGLLWAIIGFACGWALSHLGMELLGKYLKDANRYHFTGKMLVKEEIWIALLALLTGILAAIIPAFQAFKADISETLGGK